MQAQKIGSRRRPNLSLPPFLSISPPPLLSNSATRLGPDPDQHLYTAPSCHTIPCSEPSHKALIKTHDFKLSKLSKSRKDGERERERGKEMERERETEKHRERENVCAVTAKTGGSVKQSVLLLNG